MINKEILFDSQLVLENEKVKVRVLRKEDFAQLKRIAFYPEIWKYFTCEIMSEEILSEYIGNALKLFSDQTQVHFVIIDKNKDRIVGMSAFGNISIRDLRIEIGWSWLTPKCQGIGVNGEYKKLLLDFAFRKLGMERVEFKTDVLNKKARKALLKIGAREEGILRSHTLMPHNRRRNTIYYSILRDEYNFKI